VKHKSCGAYICFAQPLTLVQVLSHFRILSFYPLFLALSHSRSHAFLAPYSVTLASLPHSVSPSLITHSLALSHSPHFVMWLSIVHSLVLGQSFCASPLPSSLSLSLSLSINLTDMTQGHKSVLIKHAGTPFVTSYNDERLKSAMRLTKTRGTSS